MLDTEKLIIENLHILTSAINFKTHSGKGQNIKKEFYGVKKLRKLILELAIRGKLTPQDQNDEPASEILKKIKKEKSDLIKNGKQKKNKLQNLSNNEAKPYELPHGWDWAPLGILGNIFNGNSISNRIKDEKYTNVPGIPFLATKDIGYGFESLAYDNGIAIPFHEPKFKKASKGSVLICAEGGSAGKKCGVTDREICFGNKLFANELHGNIEPNYILTFYLTSTFYNQFSQSMTGIIGGISASKFNQIQCPLPPLKEQGRIISKVNNLMKICDLLEFEQKTSFEKHEKLVSNVLNILESASSDPSQIPKAWEQIYNNFNILFTSESSVDKFKQTILKLAVMGKLVQQESGDEPAEVLFKKITEKKGKLIEKGLLKKQKQLPHLEKEKPYQIPENWKWVRLNDAFDIRDGTHDSPQDAIGDNTYPLVTTKDFKNGKIDFTGAKRISSEDHVKICERSNVKVNDILFSMIGSIGNQVIVEDPRPFSIKNVALFKYYSQELTVPKFLKIYTEELAFGLKQKASGAVQPFISLSFLRNLPFALPPTSEQHRIVAKVDELMKLCEKLKTSIASKEAKQLNLADSLIDKVMR